MSPIAFDKQSSTAQHDQTGPNLPTPSQNADQIARLIAKTGRHAEDSNLNSQTENIRDNQRVDLAMLRLSFHEMFTEKESDPEKKTPKNVPKELLREVLFKIPDFTAGEFNQMVSAITRLHEEERTVYGIDPATKSAEEKERQEYEQFEKLSKSELLQLCRQHNILPPDLCDDQNEAENLPGISQS